MIHMDTKHIIPTPSMGQNETGYVNGITMQGCSDYTLSDLKKSRTPKQSLVPPLGVIEHLHAMMTTPMLTHIAVLIHVLKRKPALTPERKQKHTLTGQLRKLPIVEMEAGKRIKISKRGLITQLVN